MERKTKILYNGQWVDAVEVPVRSSQEHWNDYLLGDETVLRMKLIVTAVYRIEGIYDAEGNPIYHIRSGNVASASPPENLKKTPQ
jgi:hypothetical protein